jgi:hypothetical protein
MATAFGRLQMMTEEESEEEEEEEEEEEIEYRESDVVPARHMSEAPRNMEMDIENVDLMDEHSDEATAPVQAEHIQHVRLTY